MRHFRELLAPARCWDQQAQDYYDQTQILPDCIMQNREELIRFCEFIETHQIRSYLEIGIWTGLLASTLDILFDFDKLAVCDLMNARHHGLEITLPPKTQIYEGNSHTQAFIDWRKAQGHFDLILIDGDHSYEAVLKDLNASVSGPFKYIAFHDISGIFHTTQGVRKIWDSLKGHKVEFIFPNAEVDHGEAHLGLGIWWPE